MFVLYDTHGLPPELTLEVAQGLGYAVDRAGFDAEMELQRERSKGEETFTNAQDDRALRYAAVDAATEFVGYDEERSTTTVLHLSTAAGPVARLTEGQAGELVIAASPFYPEGGGQVGDHGEILSDEGRFVVEDTRRYGDTIVQIGRVTAGAIGVGERVRAHIDRVRRQDTARNHTGTTIRKVMTVVPVLMTSCQVSE